MRYIRQYQSVMPHKQKVKARTERWLWAAVAAAVQCLQFMLNIERNLRKRVEC